METNGDGGGSGGGGGNRSPPSSCSGGYRRVPETFASAHTASTKSNVT